MATQDKRVYNSAPLPKTYPTIASTQPPPTTISRVAIYDPTCTSLQHVNFMLPYMNFPGGWLGDIPIGAISTQPFGKSHRRPLSAPVTALATYEVESVTISCNIPIALQFIMSKERPDYPIPTSLEAFVNTGALLYLSTTGAQATFPLGFSVPAAPSHNHAVLQCYALPIENWTDPVFMSFVFETSVFDRSLAA
jgi:hypothetical protein